MDGSRISLDDILRAQCIAEALGLFASPLLSYRRISMLKVLNFKYNLSKMIRFVPVKWQSTKTKDHPVSSLMLTFQPNTDELKRVFDKMSNREGAITLLGLQRLLEALGKDNAAYEAHSMMQVSDLNKDGLVDFDEFKELHKRGVRTAEIQGAFWMFDQDGDGRISPEEVRAMLERLGERCSLKECRRMVSRVDRNGDGLVDMDEFMGMMTRTMKLC